MKKLKLLLLALVAIPTAAYAVGTVGNLAVTKYSDGQTLVKVQVGDSVLFYGVLTSAQMTTIRSEILNAGSGTAPTYGGPTMPKEPTLGNLLD